MIFQSNWLLFSWILFYKKTIINKSEYSANDLYIEKKMSNMPPSNITIGNDNRISLEEEDINKDNTLSKLINNKLKWNQLQILQNPHISIIEKLLIVKEIEDDNVESIYVSNIYNGGLYKDWD